MPISHGSEENRRGGSFLLLDTDVTRSCSCLIHGLAADDGADDLDVLDLLLIHRVQIVGEYDEVGELARRDRSLDRFLTRGIGAVQRIDPQRLVDADALVETPRASVPSLARHHALDTR